MDQAINGVAINGHRVQKPTVLLVFVVKFALLGQDVRALRAFVSQMTLYAQTGEAFSRSRIIS